MSLITTWIPYFKSTVRMRGRAYHESGRVEQVEPKQGELVRAQVQGTERYLVTIYSDGGNANATCTCPHFEDGQYCTHIWATLLDVHQRGLLESVDRRPSSTIDQLGHRPPKARKRHVDRGETPSTEPEWVDRLSLLRPTTFEFEGSSALSNVQREVCYVVDASLSRQHNGLVVVLHQRRPTFSGWSKSKPLRINAESIRELANPIDRELCTEFLGARRVDESDIGSQLDNDRPRTAFRLPDVAQRPALIRMTESGRCFIRTTGYDEPGPLVWDERRDQACQKTEERRQQTEDRIAALPLPIVPPWILWMVGTDTGQELSIHVELRRENERLPIDRPTLVLGGPSGVVIWDGQAGAFDDRDAFRWVAQFRDDLRSSSRASPIHVSYADVERFLNRLYSLPQLPEIDLPEELAWPERFLDPVPHLEVFTESATARASQLLAKIWFDYGNERVKPEQLGRFVCCPSEDQNAQSALIHRDLDREKQIMAPLVSLGFRVLHGDAQNQTEAQWTLPTKLMPSAVAQLLRQGWVVTADQQIIRGSKTPKLAVSSGIDWFELRGHVPYETDHGAEAVSLPVILEAARAGKATVTLGDGSEGLLPEQWLTSHGLLTTIGTLEDDHLRFKSSQAALIESLLSHQDLVEVDEKFEAARQRLTKFQAISPRNPGPRFVGTLRPYQCDGLGWLFFLQWLDMGGVLADDMGLGKTVQVLAMLDLRHSGQCEDGMAESNQPHRPSLVVVPRSVVFNWIDEAKHFTPDLRVQTYSGSERAALLRSTTDYDVLVTSYGLMRRDIDLLVEQPFEYVVLDEAQAIKNPASQSAKAARLLRAKHRLVMTGTPVENHLGDLWSILEFLNPGLLGSGVRFSQLIRPGVQSMQNVDVATQAARALRPFILRRTKQQVLADLPEKTEQTIHCEMEPAQREIYDQLRRHYQGTLLKAIDGAPAKHGVGVGRSAMMVLEALLRLRQAACHPALIDSQRKDLPSAKIDALLEQLAEVIDEGHKALVFSQFTSMLALVRERLDDAGIVYEYLDGKTRDRKKCVQRFQTDADCPVFLISLKAGGQGLNLTAAEYVFILDPWWNPAVEAQAIDRAHRIGQTQHVFAYRLICQDTVEQRILELQEQKKKLADAIVGGQENLLRTLTRNDLERLLS